MGLEAVLHGINGYFQEDDLRRRRERQAELDAQQNQRFKWDKARAESDIELLPDLAAARRAVASGMVLDNEAKAQTLPGQTANAVREQDIKARTLDDEAANLPRTLAQRRAQGALTDVQLEEQVTGHLGNMLAAGNFSAATRFANEVAADENILPYTNGAKVSGIVPVKRGSKLTAYRFSLENGQTFDLPADYVEQSRRVVNIERDKAAAQVDNIQAQAGQHRAGAALQAVQAGVATNADARAGAADARVVKREAEANQALADMADAEQRGDTRAFNAARRRAIMAGVRLEKPEQLKPEVRVGSMGDTTVFQPTGGGGGNLLMFQNGKPTGSSVIPAGGAAQRVARTATPEDIRATAQKYGISEAEVKRRLGIQ